MGLRLFRILIKRQITVRNAAITASIVLIFVKYKATVDKENENTKTRGFRLTLADQNISLADSEKHVEMLARVRHMEDACASSNLRAETLSISNRLRLFKPLYVRTILDFANKLQYCPVEKSGSTYWKRIFYINARNLKITDAYDVNIEKVLKDKLLKSMTMANQGLSRLSISQKNVTRFIFVRDPYVKLFSAYVDKLFSPNPYYWSLVGSQIVRRLRPPNSSDCGHDITFEELVIFVYNGLRQGYPFDEHFKPIFANCRPCDVHYNIIGKLETFKEDVTYVFNNAGLQKFLPSIESLSTRFEEDTLMDSIQAPFAFRESIVKCIPFSSALKRTWKKLQIRGLLSVTSVFPLTNSEADVITETYFKKIVLESYRLDKSKDDRHSNKKEALKQAYSSVKRIHLIRLEGAFRPDFKIFDYNPKPSYIYEESSTKEFDFLKLE